MAKSSYDASKDEIFGTIEALVDASGNVLAAGPEVDPITDPADTRTRYRFIAARYDGGDVKVRIRAQWVGKKPRKDGTHSTGFGRVDAWPAAHGAGKLPTIVGTLCQQALALAAAADRKAS